MRPRQLASTRSVIEAQTSHMVGFIAAIRAAGARGSGGAGGAGQTLYILIALLVVTSRLSRAGLMAAIT